MTDATPKPDAREAFKDSISLVQEVRQFVTKPPETPTDMVARLRDLHTRVRRESPFDRPSITSDVMDVLKADGEVGEIPQFEKLQTIMKGVRYPGTDKQLINGTGTFVMIDGKTGAMSFTEAKGPIHDLPVEKGDDGVERKIFPGGLVDYALGKTLVEVGLNASGKEGGTGNQENNDWAVATTGAKGIHMGGMTAKDKDGNPIYAGVSGAEMMPEAIALLNNSLKFPESKDGNYTCAGFIDMLVANWMVQVAQGNEVTLEQAQSEIDLAFDLFKNIESTGSSLPTHFH